MLPNHLYITERKRKIKHVYLDANKAKCMQYSKSSLEIEMYCDKFWVGTRKDDQEIEWQLVSIILAYRNMGS